MAELLLSAPQNGGQNTIQITQETTSLNLNFDISDALLEKVDDNLEIYFEESDSTIVLQDFYAIYNSENIPDFIVDNGFVSGEDFFAALDENLMPAAGPAANVVENNGLNGSSSTPDALATGVSALDDVLGGSGYQREGFQGEFSSSDGNVIDLTENDIAPVLENATITITAPADVDENSKRIEFTVTVDKIPSTDLVINFEDGTSVTIKAGETSTTFEKEVREDDVYKDSDDVIAPEIVGHEGGNFADVEYDNSNNSVTVTDDNDETTLELKVKDDNVEEGEKIEYELELSNPAGTDMTVTVTVGGVDYDVEIEAGSTTGSLIVDARPDDAYDQGDKNIDASIKDVVGGNFENLTTSGNPSVTVTEDKTPETTTITIVAPADVDENATEVEFTVKVDRAPETDLVIKLDNGKEVTIPKGETSTTFTEEVRVDDVYNDANDVIAPEIVGHEGGNYENVEYDNSDNSVTVTDDNDTTTLELSAKYDSVKEGGTIDYELNLSNPAGSDMTVTVVVDGQEYEVEIKEGESSASLSVDARDNDAFIQGNESIDASIKDVSGGNFENLTTSGTPSVTVTDTGTTPDVSETTTITIVAPADVDENATEVEFTVKVDRAPETDLVIKLDNGKEVTIPKGETSTTFTEEVRVDDVYNDANDVIAPEIVGHEGGNYENVEYDNSNNSVTVTDDNDTTTLTLSSEADIVLQGDSIEYTLELTSPADTDMTVIVTVNGVDREVTIAKGESTATFDVTTSTNSSALDVSIKSTSGGNFENLVVDKTDVEVEIMEDAVIVHEGGLAEGTDSTATTESVTWEVPEGYEVVLDNSSANGNPYVLETDAAGNLIITLNDNVTHNKNTSDTQLTRPDSVTVQLKDPATGETVEVNIDVTIVDDAPVIKTDNVGDNNNDGISDVLASVTEGQASANISIDFGADMEGATIHLPKSEGATFGLTATWNGSEWTSPSWMIGVETSYDDATGMHTIKFGDITMTSTDNQNWEVSYETISGGREDVVINFTDGDGDTVQHQVIGNAPTIEAQGNDILADDSALAGGTDTPVDMNLNGEIDFSLGEGTLAEHSFTVNVGGEEYTLNKSGATEVEVNGGTLTFTINPSDNSLSYSFEQSGAFEHDNALAGGETAGTETDFADQFNVTITDKNGNTLTSDDIDININDDAPVIPTNPVETTTEGTEASTFVRIEFGADNGDGKSLEFGDSTFTYDAESGKWTTESEGASVEYSEDGKTVNLISSDGTELSNHDGNVLWNAKLTDVPENGQQTESIKVTDSDGDSVSFDIIATNTPDAPTSEIIGLDGSTSQMNSGQNYNIAIILDTSGSMYDDGNADIKDVGGEVVSRLGQACDAIADFVINTLHSHANSEIGGEVNVLLTTFWRETENGDSSLTSNKFNSEDGQSSSATYIETLDPADFAGMSENEIYSQIAKILAMNAQGVTYNSETGEFEYDAEAHKALTEALKNPELDADSAYKPLDGNDTGFHWGTEYHQGFETAAEWFEQVSQDGFINETFLITDGVPYDSEAERTKAYNELLEAMGIEILVDANGNPILEADGRHIPVDGSEHSIHGVGVGAGANKDTLNKFDTTETGATIVTDSDIKDIFTPTEGGVDVSTVTTSVAMTGAGNDVLIGGIDTGILKAWLAKQIGVEADAISDIQLSEYMHNYPEWINDQSLDNSTANDPDALVAGAGDDVIYGQGGEDLLIGDGNESTLEALAEKLGMENSEDYAAENLKTPENMTEEEAVEFSENIQDLVIDLVDQVQSADIEDLAKAAQELEVGTTDGNDTIFGGDADKDGFGGDDILLGLGGDDDLYGGSGDDILIGGSGDDYLEGGSGDDILIGGEGNDILVGGEGNDTFYFAEDSFAGGEVDTIVDLSSGDMIDLTSFSGKDYNIEVGGENNQDIIISKGEDVFTIRTNLDLSSEEIDFDSITINI